MSDDTHVGAGSWAAFSQAEPDLAGRVQRRFAANVHHVLGTVRPDGSPRLSGTEVAIDDEVRLGMMPGSRKLHDVRRDPRVELHSAPLERDLLEGDARISGRLLEEVADPATEPGGVFLRLAISRVGLVRVVDDELHLMIWSPEAGSRVLRRR